MNLSIACSTTLTMKLNHRMNKSILHKQQMILWCIDYDADVQCDSELSDQEICECTTTPSIGCRSWRCNHHIVILTGSIKHRKLKDYMLGKNSDGSPKSSLDELEEYIEREIILISCKLKKFTDFFNCLFVREIHFVRIFDYLKMYSIFIHAAYNTTYI